MNPRKIYLETKEMLAKAGVDNAAFEADLIIKEICGAPRLLLSDVNIENIAKIRDMAARRAAHEPLQYIFGQWQFLDVKLKVGKGVLIPRPETEEVCLAAAQLIKDIERPVALDLCSGSGAVALGLQRLIPNADVTAVELDGTAFEYLEENIMLFELEPANQNIQSLKRAPPRAIKADVFEYCEELDDNSVDLIVCNPPYVTEEEYAQLEPEVLAEPARALIAGEGGLELYIAIARDYKQKLKCGGWLIFEIGASQGEAVADILDENGYECVEVRKDMAGFDRVVVGVKAK